ncbi:MAG: pyridoxal phosphate-dependent aminotransferase [Planctomycetota bacterium]|jgi:histidinol-phosphate aminotransferase
MTQRTTKTQALRPATPLRRLAPYSPCTSAPGIDLKLDANETCPPTVDLDVALANLAQTLNRYPDASGLEQTIASSWNIDPERVVVTGGADDAIDRTCRAFLEPGRALLTHTPTFEMIERSSRLAGATIRTIDWLDGPVPLDALRRATLPDTGLIAVVTPNNPTGSTISTEQLLELAHHASLAAVPLMVDLAYIEFDKSDPTPLLLQHSNVIVVRTFSKALGLAGLRVGYTISSPLVASWIRTTGSPYPVASPSLVVCEKAIRHPEIQRDCIRRIKSNRESLQRFLIKRGMRTFPSRANFVTFLSNDAPAYHQRLRELSIAVRGLCIGSSTPNAIRITLPTSQQQLAILLDALDRILP